jgi:hypothetical protein
MKRIILVALLGLGIFSSQAQETYNSTGRAGQPRYKENQKKKGFDVNRLVFGGNLGLTFGTITNIYIAPSIGYRITDNFAAGISLGYNYYRQKDAIYTYNVDPLKPSEYRPFSQSIYTGSIWGRYIIIPNIMVQAEFEANNLDDYSDPLIPNTPDKNGWMMPGKRRVTVPSLLLGGGFRQPVGEHASMYIMAMYDVLQNIPSNMREDNSGGRYSISPYANRLDIRVGFMLGF